MFTNSEKIFCGIICIFIIIGLLTWIFNGTPTKQITNPIIINKSIDKNEMETVNPNAKFTLYNFYNPGCGWCKKFMPVWNEIKNKMSNNPNLLIKSINTALPENENLVFYYNITGYPTVIMTTQIRHIEYEGDRSFDDLSKFINSIINE